MFNKVSRLNLDEIKQQTIFPEADVVLGVGDRCVQAKTTGAGAAFTVTLPSVVEAAGEFYSVTMVTRDAAKDITVQDKDDDAGLGDVVLDLAAEHVILLSNGYTWALIFDSR